MLKRIVLTSVVLAFLGAVSEAQSISELLEKGIYTEETVGDLDAAIKIYEKIVDEDQANRKLVAEAQLRLGQCLMKQGKKKEAKKALQELVDQFKDSPAQKELVEKARKLLPPQAWFALEPVPWSDGEQLEMRIKLAGGMEIGVFTYAAHAGKADGRDVWNLTMVRNIVINAPNLGYCKVTADRKSFDPIRSVFRHTLLGDYVVDYAPGEATVHTTGVDGKKSERTQDLNSVYYDNEQGWYVFRCLPLADNSKITVPIFAPLGEGPIGLESEVVGKEEVETPAGTFNCYKLFLKLVQQTFWISDDSHRYVVKFEAGGITGMLQSIRQVKPGDTITQSGGKLGFSLTAPADWYFLPMTLGRKGSEELFYLTDPEAVSVTALRVRSLNDLSDDERTSVRTWAEKKITETARASKDHQVRQDSWQEFEVGGLPAVCCLADYVQGEKKRSRYYVFILGKSTAAMVSADTTPDQLDGFRKKLTPILDSYKEK